ncbi:uncharacterized protein LOC128212873 [Mya arenaria]|uniref:uncharacterized protein LOC128212873 n=1 Tax=Mya arenaria TaxID=6604 RepID=UPI0022E643FC|nr:uncharacterized protein LOC128212873 [Mya arenaria]
MSEKNNGNKKSTVTPVEEIEMENVCAMRPGHENMLDNLPCCGKLREKFYFKVLVFMMVLLLDAADLVSDWLLFHDVIMTKEGLVYGPPEDALKYSLLVFSIIGTITFAFEVANLWWEVFRKNPWLDIDLLSAIIVWIEDVPQIVINVFIVACREEAISYFQLVKASVIIVGVVVRIIVSLVRYCSKNARHDLQCAKQNKDSCRHVVYRSFIMIGLIITLGGAIVIFMFTQSERNPDGSLNFKIPHSVIEGEYDDEKYFSNVSVYFSHKMLDGTGSKLTLSDANILRLVKIDHIKNEDYDLSINVSIKVQSSQTEYKIDGANPVTECFTLNKNSDQITIQDPCPATHASPHSDKFYFTFHYTKPSVPSLIFGDITFNLKTSKGNGNCQSPDFTIDNSVVGHTKNIETAALHYYRATVDVSDNYHIKRDGKNIGNFYHPRDLTDITLVWKTGFAYCSSSGSLAPHRDNDLQVNC